MCFSLRPGVHKATLATKNIFAYKALYVNGDKITSPSFNARWTPKKMKHARGFKKCTMFSSIDEGLHCFKNKTLARYYTSGVKVFKVKIPKGAYYYENSTQYVSNKMMITCKTPIKLKKRV